MEEKLFQGISYNKKRSKTESLEKWHPGHGRSETVALAEQGRLVPSDSFSKGKPGDMH